MSDEGEELEELEPGQLDEIGRRMADVIEDQEESVTEHVDPHWEVFYDKEHDDAEKIVHLHGDERVPATVTVTPDGGSRAECTQCDETLEMAPGVRERNRIGA